MERRKYVRVGGLMLAAAIIGYLIGPPIAQAAVGLTMIRDSRTAAKARVTAGNLWVNDSGSAVYVKPFGETVLVSSLSTTPGSPFTGAGDLTGVSIDVTTAGSTAMTLVVRKGSVQDSGTIIWQGTLPAAGHLEYAFSQDIYLPAGFNYRMSGTGGALQFEIYGAGFGVAFAPPAASSKSSG